MSNTTSGRRIVIFFLLLLFPAGAASDSFQLNYKNINQKQTAVAKLHLGEGGPRLELYWRDKNRNVFKTFEALEKQLEKEERQLMFAANAGIYRDSPSLSPIGLHIENGNILSRLSFAKGCGNFCWYSGVFMIRNNQAFILSREKFSVRDAAEIRIALQSGPIFIVSKKLQGRWSSTSFNRNRSAICTTEKQGEVLLLLVTDATNFTDFFNIAIQCGCRDALFLDGEVSSFYDGRSRKRMGGFQEPYAGMLAVAAPAE